MTSEHPYRVAPRTAFWSRAVSTGWNPRDLVQGSERLLRPGDAIMSAGSCFAGNIIPFLKAAGFNYLQLEGAEVTGTDPIKDRFGYGQYSAAYGNIYTARQLLQLLRRAFGRFKPIEDRWPDNRRVVDPFRPGLPFPAESDEEFDLLLAGHLKQVRAALQAADVFIFTLGLTECWTSAVDGAVFPACPGTIAGSFDPERHVFKNFSVAEVTADLEAFFTELQQVNPKVRLILTVSPVPLVATATDQHVMTASAYSKSVLRVACEEMHQRSPEVVYFPAYELIVNARSGYFEDDYRSVSKAGVESVMDALFAHSEMPSASSLRSKADDAAVLSQGLAKYECEERMMDPQMSQTKSR